MLDKKVGSHGEVWGEDFVFSAPWQRSEDDAAATGVVQWERKGVGGFWPSGDESS